MTSHVVIDSAEQAEGTNRIAVRLSGELGEDVETIRLRVLRDNDFVTNISSQIFATTEVQSAINNGEPLFFTTGTTNTYNVLEAGEYSILAEPLNADDMCSGHHSVSEPFAFSPPLLTNFFIDYGESSNVFSVDFTVENVTEDVILEIFGDRSLSENQLLYTQTITPNEFDDGNYTGTIVPYSFIRGGSDTFYARVKVTIPDPDSETPELYDTSSTEYYPTFANAVYNIALRYWYVTLVLLIVLGIGLFLHQNHWYTRTNIAPLAVLPFQRHRALRKTQRQWNTITSLTTLSESVASISPYVESLWGRAQQLQAQVSSLEKLETEAQLIQEARDKRKKRRVRPLKHYDNLILDELIRIQTQESRTLFAEFAEFEKQVKRYRSLQRPESPESLTLKTIENHIEWLSGAIQKTRSHLESYASYFTRANELEPFQYIGELAIELRQMRLANIANDMLASNSLLEIMQSRLEGFIAATPDFIPPPRTMYGSSKRNDPEYPNLLHLWLTYILEDVKRLRQSFEHYAKQIENRIEKALDEASTIEDLLNIENVLDSIEGKRFGGTLDIVLDGLRDVTQEVASALAQSGYGRRLALQEAHINAKNLQAALTGSAPLLAKRLKVIADFFVVQRSADDFENMKTYSNPYVTGNPIRANLIALFKGRANLTADIVNRLRGGRRGTILLHGARRIGKSSFLYHLENLLPTGFIPVLVDCQGATTENEVSFFWSIAKRIYDVLRKRDSTLGNRISRPARPEYAESPANRLEERLSEEVTPSIGKRATIFITLDEFEEIGNAIHAGRMSESVLGELRHLIQHSESLVFMFVGVGSLDALGVNAASYFISVSPIELSYLDKISAENLILRPYEPEDPTIKLPNSEIGTVPAYDDVAVAEILRLTRHQPYLVQAFCEQIIELANNEQLETITLEHVTNIASKMDNAYPNYFDYYWNEWGTVGQGILRAVATQTPINGDESTQKIVQQMLRHRLIEYISDNQYAVEIPLMQMYLKKKV